MRFTLLCASTALAASLVLSACSGGTGSSTIPGAARRTSQMANHHGAQLVSTGAHRPQTCTSPYYICYLIAPGADPNGSAGASASADTARGSGLYAGKVKWKNDDGCAGAKTNGPSGCTGKVKSKWGPPAAVVGIIYDNVYREGQRRVHGRPARIQRDLEATVKNGSLKGDVFVEPTGIIIGPY